MPMQRFEYVWIDGYGGVRSKTRILFGLRSDVPPDWNYDGSSCGQATTRASEILLRPVRVYPSPFPFSDYLVLCETFEGTQPHASNTRVACAVEIGQNAVGARFGFEQEFFLTDTAGEPLGPRHNPQKNYYCGVGANNALGRLAVETAMENCLKAGLPLTGMNAEVAPGQWELQIDAMGMEACDGLWMLRYILAKTVETFNLGVTFHPKPLSAPWNGSGCHANFSTNAMRAEGGLAVIHSAIERLGHLHHEHMASYGEDNHQRLTGECETSSIDAFTWGIGDRSASVRIPMETETNECGYLEDRRPASNMDPYVVARLLVNAASEDHADALL